MVELRNVVAVFAAVLIAAFGAERGLYASPALQSMPHARRLVGAPIPRGGVVLVASLRWRSVVSSMGSCLSSWGV